MVVPFLYPLNNLWRKSSGTIFFSSFAQSPRCSDNRTLNSGWSGTAAATSAPSRRLFLACPSTCGLNHAKTTHVPSWSSSAGWSDGPHRELPCRGLQRLCHATASGGWSACQWNLPRCTRQGSTLTAVPTRHINHLTPALTPTMIH